jgi:hypothetical protein
VVPFLSHSLAEHQQSARGEIFWRNFSCRNYVGLMEFFHSSCDLKSLKNAVFTFFQAAKTSFLALLLFFFCRIYDPQRTRM